MMRDTKTDGWFVQNSSDVPMRAVRIAAVALAVGFVAMTGAARAQEEDDGKTFEEKMMDGIMAGIGGTNMDNRGIDYRERSPLVVPPKLDLPPPQANTAAAKPPRIGQRIPMKPAARRTSRAARRKTRIRSSNPAS